MQVHPKAQGERVKITRTRRRWMTLERRQRCGVKSQLRIKDMRDHVRLALMMAMTAMFTLAGYELMRSASTVLFKQTYGAENLPLVMAVMPLVMLLGVWGYGRLLSAVGPQRTLNITTLLAAGIILLAWALTHIAKAQPLTVQRRQRNIKSSKLVHFVPRNAPLFLTKLKIRASNLTEQV